MKPYGQMLTLLLTNDPLLMSKPAITLKKKKVLSLLAACSAHCDECYKMGTLITSHIPVEGLAKLWLAYRIRVVEITGGLPDVYLMLLSVCSYYRRREEERPASPGMVFLPLRPPAGGDWLSFIFPLRSFLPPADFKILVTRRPPAPQTFN